MRMGEPSSLTRVGEISPHMQVKLLRVIEGNGFTPVGSSQVKTSEVRIIAATNRDLKVLVKNGIMREDFFYRIHILPIHLPPLRERKGDLPLLVNHFMKLYAGKRNVPRLTGKLMEKLHHYNWPGNVRELQNVIVRYCNQKQIDLPSASAKPQAPPDQMSYPDTRQSCTQKSERHARAVRKTAYPDNAESVSMASAKGGQGTEC